MNDEPFYDRIPTLNDFAVATDPAHYVRVPSDWSVAVGDVRDSTTAIDEGDYKAVNVVGASVIAATLNAVGHRSVPYTFGGDGALLCVPDGAEDAVQQALGGTRRMAREEFGLRLDVGLVPISALEEAGHAVWVARYRLSETIEQAVFMGAGLSAAEEWVKSRPDGPYGVPGSTTGPADFSGLECRWDQVPSPRQEIVALLVRATGSSLRDSARIYDEVLSTLRAIYGADDGRRPLRHGQLRMTFAPRKLAAEQQVRTHGDGWAERLAYWPKLWLQNVLGVLLMGMDWTTESTAWGEYKKDLAAHTDFRKMDGTLRQVLAGTRDQRERLDAYLRSEYEDGRLVYGLDASDAAMVTCLVFQYEKEHVHFVDGADGGYAHAAQALKARSVAREQ